MHVLNSGPHALYLEIVQAKQGTNIFFLLENVHQYKIISCKLRPQ